MTHRPVCRQLSLSSSCALPFSCLGNGNSPLAYSVTQGRTWGSPPCPFLPHLATCWILLNYAFISVLCLCSPSPLPLPEFRPFPFVAGHLHQIPQWFPFIPHQSVLSPTWFLTSSAFKRSTHAQTSQRLEPNSVGQDSIFKNPHSLPCSFKIWSCQSFLSPLVHEIL